MKKKNSYGIALCVEKNNELFVLMVKKRYSYQFMEFVSGKYKRNDDATLIKLFDNMTLNEKILISKLSYEDLWYNIWLVNPTSCTPADRELSFIYSRTNYGRKKEKFNSAFLRDDGRKLKNLLNRSDYSETPWEFPKGRKKVRETHIDTAKREFYEETNIEDDCYDLMYHIKPIYEVYKSGNVLYTHIYYIAKLNSRFDKIPKISIKNRKQVSEIECIKWVSKKSFECLKMSKENMKRKSKHMVELKKSYKKTKKVNVELIEEMSRELLIEKTAKKLDK